ncbi:MAG: hypothetical protein B7Y41_13015 [Hydrogenophilales bacterium 28-61-23]|nr:MAG: hypothetical protein B7Y41_13015 [Hydrogenophilales bacterium 28-61-23]
MRLPVPKFKVLLYGPDIPARGVNGRAHFEESVLVVQAQGHWFTVPGALLQLKLDGFDGRQWVLVWQTPSGPVTALLQGEDAVELFIKLAPPDVSNALKLERGAHGARIRSLRIWSALLAALALVLVVGSGLLWRNAEKASLWLACQISQEQKNRLGELALGQMPASLKLLERGEVLNTVQFIGVRVSTGSRLRYNFHVAESPEVDAVALPGGHVIVYTGLLREVKNASELAAVLAQEASHIEKRHTLGNVIHALGWRAVLAALLGDSSSPVWDGMATQLRTMRYSPELEREADNEALLMLHRAGVSSAGLLSFLERGAERERATGGASAIPLPIEQRVADLRAQIAAQPAYQSQPLPVDWQRFQDALSRL